MVGRHTRAPAQAPGVPSADGTTLMYPSPATGRHDEKSAHLVDDVTKSHTEGVDGPGSADPARSPPDRRRVHTTRSADLLYTNVAGGRSC